MLTVQLCPVIDACWWLRRQALALPFLQEGLPPTDTTPTPDASSPQQHHLPHLMAPLTEAYNGFRRFTHMARFKVR